MNPDWTSLDTELSRWEEAGLSLPLWWRDDDAVAPTPAFEQLQELSANLGLPVYLAIIPAEVETTLAEAVSTQPHLIPVIHGWAHANHAPADEKKAEFGAHRPLAELQHDAECALKRMSDLFGDNLCPIFVPPWNRIDPQLPSLLPALGYSALSTFTPRVETNAAPGLIQINTHIDPINWRGGRGLASTEALIEQIAGQLGDRRLSHADNAEPYGILTHHLVHDQAIWAFTEQLLIRLLAGPTYPWRYSKRNIP